MSRTSTATPARRRTVAAASSAPSKYGDIERLMAEFYRENDAANSAARKAEKAREQLLAAMTAQGLTVHTCEAVNSAGQSLPLVANIKASEREVMDIQKLKALVTGEVFEKCISASKKAVEEHAGTAVATAAAIVRKGEPNVSVKVRK